MDGAQPVLPRSGRFNRAPLVQLLADGGHAQASPQPLSLAQRFGPWLAWTDAIALSAVLAEGAASLPSAPAAGLTAAARQVIAEGQRLRHDLAQAIAQEPMFRNAASADALADAPANSDAPALGADDLAALRRQHRQHQQAMGDRIAPLRARLRAVMAGVSPALGRLAALDTVLDPSLSARQHQLLGAVPTWLAQGAARQPAAAPAQVQAALLAELDLRWQPIAGLIGALHEAAGGQP